MITEILIYKYEKKRIIFDYIIFYDINEVPCYRLEGSHDV